MPDDAPSRPLPVQVAFGLVMAAAAASAVLGLSPLLMIDANIRNEAQRDASASPDAVAATVGAVTAVLVVIALLFAVALLVFGLRFRRGRPRARIALVVLTVLSVLPLAVPALLITALLVVADVLAFRPASTAWLRGEAGG